MSTIITEAMRINFGVALIQIMEFNEKEQYLKTKLWLRQVQSPRLKSDTKTYQFGIVIF